VSARRLPRHSQELLDRLVRLAEQSPTQEEAAMLADVRRALLSAVYLPDEDGGSAGGEVRDELGGGPNDYAGRPMHCLRLGALSVRTNSLAGAAAGAGR